MSMNLLFIHGNFPGQFLNIAPFLASSLAKRVIFLTEADNKRVINLEGVEVLRFTPHRSPSKSIHQYLYPVEKSVLRGQAVIRVLDKLAFSGFRPDVIIAQAGSGYGLYVKDLLPDARLISYVEWYPNPETSSHLFAKFGLNEQIAMATEFWPFVHELQQSDDLVCPTNWQKSQFPSPWNQKIKVIFDGIDTSLFYPRNIDRDIALTSCTSGNVVNIPATARVLTYATRGMEPLRGFPEFMRAAAFAQKNDPKLQILIAGLDRTVYSYPPPEPFKSWKIALLSELRDQLNLDKVHFIGLLSYAELISLYCRSNLHCYFTRPYVISWSVFEASACGAHLLTNSFPGLEEVFLNSPNLTPVDLDNQDTVNHAVVDGLSRSLVSKVPPRLSLLPPDKHLENSLRQWRALLITA